MEVDKNGNVQFLTDAEIAVKKLEEQKLKDKAIYNKIEFTTLFDTDVGIEFLQEIMKRSNYERSSLLLSQNMQNTTDPLRLAYFDGMREMFIETLSLLDKRILIKLLEKNER